MRGNKVFMKEEIIKISLKHPLLCMFVISICTELAGKGSPEACQTEETNITS